MKPVPVRVIMNAPVPKVLGLMELSTGIGFWTVTAAVPCLVGSAALVATTVIVLGFGGKLGA